MNEAIFYNALNVFLESDYRKLKKLRERYKSWYEAWMGAAEKNLDPDKEWEKISKLGAKLVMLDDHAYPRPLKEITDPPFGIYVLGRFPEEWTMALAIVGTRKTTFEGKAAAKNFAEKAAEAGLIVISGLALGIDAAAHEGCLNAGGKTVAVLGSGIDVFYPRTNEKLAKKILEKGGAIISEYPPGSPPLPYRFLERNRIVSGLSRGALIIEAPERSGSLVTARLALEQNRDVFVVPGPINHPNYRGSNQLIRQGAELVTKPEEILEAFGIISETKPAHAALLETDEEKRIFAALKGTSSPASVDKICELTDIGAVEANRALTMMILKDLIVEAGGGYIIK